MSIQKGFDNTDDDFEDSFWNQKGSGSAKVTEKKLLSKETPQKDSRVSDLDSNDSVESSDSKPLLTSRIIYIKTDVPLSYVTGTSSVLTLFNSLSKKLKFVDDEDAPGIYAMMNRSMEFDEDNPTRLEDVLREVFKLPNPIMGNGESIDAMIGIISVRKNKRSQVDSDCEPEWLTPIEDVAKGEATETIIIKGFFDRFIKKQQGLDTTSPSTFSGFKV